MDFHSNLSDSMFPQVSWIILSIQADLNNAVVWIIFTCPVISKPSNPFTNLLKIVQTAPFTIGIDVIFIFNIFFLFLFSKNVSVLMFLLILLCNLPGGQSPLYAGSLFFFNDLVVWPRLGDPFVSENLKEVCASYSPGWILVSTYTIWLKAQIYF